MPIDILSVISWIVEAWFLIIVLKWGARLLLGAIGVEPDRWIRRLRLMSFVRKKTQRDGRQIGRGSVYLVGSVADARHEVVHARSEDEAVRIAGDALRARDDALTVTEVYESVLSR